MQNARSVRGKTTLLPLVVAGAVLMIGCGAEESPPGLSGAAAKSDNVKASRSYDIDVNKLYFVVSNDTVSNEYRQAFEEFNAQFQRFEQNGTACGPRLTLTGVTSKWRGPPNKHYIIKTNVQLPDPACPSSYTVDDIPYLLLQHDPVHSPFSSFFVQIEMSVSRLTESEFGGVPTAWDYNVVLWR